ncbi:hypothetical protein EYF80_002391 [Liparis tanakae]|uniref:Uncharacterized protein n=1 Tax=Liparis tanakae TaxID=230148 RepID=A0A4Z2JAE4_9TELE|nr:hypothetical protein EYF80_002391 [Liparis tanakae]
MYGPLQRTASKVTEEVTPHFNNQQQMSQRRKTPLESRKWLGHFLLLATTVPHVNKQAMPSVAQHLRSAGARDAVDRRCSGGLRLVRRGGCFRIPGRAFRQERNTRERTAASP